MILRIRFVAASGLMSDTIRAAQLGFPYAHVDVGTPEGLFGAHAAGGVQVRPRSYDVDREATEMFAAVEVLGPIGNAFHDYLRVQIGKPSIVLPSSILPEPCCGTRRVGDPKAPGSSRNAGSALNSSPPRWSTPARSRAPLPLRRATSRRGAVNTAISGLTQDFRLLPQHRRRRHRDPEHHARSARPVYRQSDCSRGARPAAAAGGLQELI